MKHLDLYWTSHSHGEEHYDRKFDTALSQIAQTSLSHYQSQLMKEIVNITNPFTIHILLVIYCVKGHSLLHC